METFNKVIVLGRVSREPESRFTPGGVAVTDIRLALLDKRRVASTGEVINDVTFIDVTTWRATAKYIGENAKKGSYVLVEGRLHQDDWERDGIKRSKIKIMADRAILIEGKDEETNNQPNDKTERTEDNVQIERTDN